MAWDRIIGQEHVKNLLRRGLESGRYPHAWLFSGPEGVGKDAAAIEVAKVLRCTDRPAPSVACDNCQECRTVEHLQNPSLQFVFSLPTGKGEDSRRDPPLMKLSDSEISLIQEELQKKGENPYHNISLPRAQQIKISSIRQVRREASLTSSQPGVRVVIVSEAHLMGEEAANAFLKTLEEPSSSTLLILTSSHPERLLATITSRCQEIRFGPLTESEIATGLVERFDIPPSQADLSSRLSNGSFSRACDLVDGEIHQLRQDVVTFLRNVLRRSPVAAHGEIERITSGSDKVQLERLLGLLALWLRDALLLRLEGSEAGLVNSDQIEDMRSFNRNFSSVSLPAMIGAVEEAIRSIRRNGQPPLVLTVLAMQLIDLCFRKEMQIA